MSYKNFANRRRWAIEQKKRACAAFVPVDNSKKLEELRQLASMMETMPQMAPTLLAVRAEIAKLEKFT